ncbi:uncharacterized protein A1O5_11236 [Cladophialophora psammophila CBS 110553]|uniref:Glycosyl hydrolase family 32 N-terminal domain-containing protein n=1 Tax=Cladophialophora psammophila CBS 110553 TaxID=1182543 RepID=W9X5I3_9EURO|nr:uncharacterized protein A1O5_11236 [Cladophialophora psammophila CBS 110553]EXJ65709.1 hypothetical protein A1O5_11236 [Cladophialophora psammophila CBS 110553]
MKFQHILNTGLLTIPPTSLSHSPPCMATSLPFNINPSTPENTANYTPPVFPITPFQKYAHNPILRPNPAANWESAYLYNPTAIVLNETIFLLYRAQNSSKTSSIGLAWSIDGVTFTRLNRPIVYATEPWEHLGGTEDPRIVRVNGTFYMTYTAYDGVTPQLCLATSTDLLSWQKYPPLFPGYQDVEYSDIDVPSPRINHSKSGAIISEPTADGLYHMYFGDSFFYHATSRNLLNWTALPADQYFASPVNPWENRLIEPGPPPVKTRDGKWLLIYNGMTTGRVGYPQNQYSVGQMLIDPSGSFRPTLNLSDGAYQPALRDGPVARLERPILVPEAGNEQKGQVNQVVFAEGLVQFKGKWYLYFGQGDSELGVAIADEQS